jgi:hypothetical protein
MSQPSYYAVYQAGYTIFGTGRSADAALADAQPWLLDTEADTIIRKDAQAGTGEVQGALYLRPCTARLHNRVQRNGGDCVYRLNEHGELDLFEKTKA